MNPATSSEKTQTMPAGVEPGVCLGRLKVIRRLGSGGMGDVYLARHLDLGRDFALKVLRDHPGGLVQRVLDLRNEARVLGGLQHPNIVAVTDFGHWQGQPYLVMEFAAGGSLVSRLEAAGGRLGEEECHRVLKQALAGLAQAHDAGVVHGDFKPANVLLAADGTAKVADFGVAFKPAGPRPGQARPGESLDDGETQLMPLPRSGSMGGTPAFMAPEVRDGQEPSPASDVWSFGATLFQVLTGNPVGTVVQPPSRLVPTLDSRWDEFVAACLAAAPAERPANGREALRLWPGIEQLSSATASPGESGSNPVARAGAGNQSGLSLRPGKRFALVAMTLLLALLAGAWAWTRYSQNKVPAYRSGGSAGSQMKPLLPK